MKEHDRRQLFLRPWGDLAIGHWLKYPNLQHCPHVVHLDYLDRHVDSDGSLHTTRLLGCRQPMPQWLQTMWNYVVSVFDDKDNSNGHGMTTGSSGYWWVQETSIVDPKSKSLRLISHPISGYGIPDVCSFEEHCHYHPIYYSSPNTEGTTNKLIRTGNDGNIAFTNNTLKNVTAADEEEEHVHCMLHQRIKMDIRLPSWMSRWGLTTLPLETFLIERFEDNAERGRLALEEAIEFFHLKRKGMKAID